MVCDIQDAFREVIYQMPPVIQTAKFMLDCAHVLGIPSIVTEQYPKAFGPTVAELGVADGVAIPKTKFSMLVDEISIDSFEERPSVVLTGVEAHVCVQQTCLDLIQLGHEVHVLVDGVSSQRELDRKIALRRMEMAGAFLTTSESVIFELMEHSRHPSFKTVSSLVKNRKEHWVD